MQAITLLEFFSGLPHWLRHMAPVTVDGWKTLACVLVCGLFCIANTVYTFLRCSRALRSGAL